MRVEVKIIAEIFGYVAENSQLSSMKTELTYDELLAENLALKTENSAVKAEAEAAKAEAASAKAEAEAACNRWKPSCRPCQSLRS